MAPRLPSPLPFSPRLQRFGDLDREGQTDTLRQPFSSTPYFQVPEGARCRSTWTHPGLSLKWIERRDWLQYWQLAPQGLQNQTASVHSSGGLPPAACRYIAHKPTWTRGTLLFAVPVRVLRRCHHCGHAAGPSGGQSR